MTQRWDAQPYAAPYDAPVRSGRWAWMIVIGLAVGVAAYLFFIRTYTGQYLENAALLGAKQNATAAEMTDALDDLRVISYVSLGVAIIAVGIVGLARKSWRIGAAGAFVIAGATITTELLKKVILPRPDLAQTYADNASNSFPSGHTTIAMSILVALLVVTSYRWRGIVMFFAVAWATAVGSATVTARWHRFSDTLGADMVALIFGAIALIWLYKHGEIRRVEGKTHPWRVIYIVILSGVGVVTLALGATLSGLTIARWDVGWGATTLASNAVADPEFSRNLFFAAQSLALAFSILSALWIWATLHRLESHTVTPGR